MTKHPTLIEIVRQKLKRQSLTHKDAIAVIGISHATFSKFLAGQKVSEKSMAMIRAFTENANVTATTSSAKGKKKGKGSEIALDDLRFMQDMKPDDLKFVVSIMEATGQTSLTRDQMTNLISLRK